MKWNIEKKYEICAAPSQAPYLGRTAGGDLLLLHANFCDCMPGCHLTLRRSTDGGHTWGQPEMTVEPSIEGAGVEGSFSCLGDLAFIAYLEGCDLKRHPFNPTRCWIMRSTDGGRHWSGPQSLDGAGAAMMPSGKIIRLRNNGRLLLPAWGFVGWLNRAGGNPHNYILASDDEGLSWHLHARIRKDPATQGVEMCEIALCELLDGRLLTIMRGDSHNPDAFAYSFRSISEDGGKTWSPAAPTNISVCEPRLVVTEDQPLLLVARSWPGNRHLWYRPLGEHEREPGSGQTETLAAEELDESRTPVSDYGVMLFTSNDDGQTWEPLLTMQNPRDLKLSDENDRQMRHRYQAGFPDVLVLDRDRLMVVFRQPDPGVQVDRPGLTYSHTFQRFVAANIIVRQ